MPKSFMCHVVAGYPDLDASMSLLKGMEQVGVDYVEIQIPFTDPIADGELIMYANDKAIQNGMITEKAFELLSMLAVENYKPSVFVMTYLQKIFSYGAEKFCTKLKQCNVKGLIVPDLPFDTPEFKVIKNFAKQNGIAVVSVISPGMSTERLHKILSLKPEFAYITSQRGITGRTYHQSTELASIAKEVKDRSTAQVIIGFGIKTKSDMVSALTFGDIAVVGSAIVKSLEKSSIPKTLKFIKELAESTGRTSSL